MNGRRHLENAMQLSGFDLGHTDTAAAVVRHHNEASAEK